MGKLGFQSSINKFLIFKDRELENIYQSQRHAMATKTYFRLMSFAIIIIFLLFILSTKRYYDQENTEKEEEIYKFQWISLITLIITALIEYGMMKFGIRKLRAIISIIRANIVLFLLPYNTQRTSFGCLGMWIGCYIVVCGIFISYNWITASITQIIGILLAGSMLIVEYDFYIIGFAILIGPVITFIFYWAETEHRITYFLMNQSQKKECHWKNVLNEIPESIIVASGRKEVELYSNPQAKLLCLNLGMNTGVELADNFPRAGGQIELATEEDGKKSLFLECGKGVNLIFEEEECILYLIKDQTELKKREHEALKSEYSTMLLCSLSHELRTPLNGILGVLEAQLPNLAPEYCLEFADSNEELCLNALRSSKLLWYFVSGILALTQFQTGELKVKYEIVHPVECVKYCIDLIRKEVESRGIELKEEYSGNKEGYLMDELKYQIIVITLLLNAAKYTFKGYIKVSIWREGEVLMTSVQDTGIGIADSTQLTLFQLFGKLQHIDHENSQIYQHSTPIHGVGFGLAISKQLTEAMGGKIFVESTKEVGSKFTFSLHTPESLNIIQQLNPHKIDSNEPILTTEIIVESDGLSERSIPLENIGKTSEIISLGSENFGTISHFPLLQTSQDEVKMIASNNEELHIESDYPMISSINGEEDNKYQEEGTKPIKVLIVDDTSINIFALRMLLKKLQIESDSAANGLEGIEKVKMHDGEYSIIFMDCNMPVMDGFQATFELKRRMHTGMLISIPIIALTAYASNKVEEECLKAGMDDIYFKPISLSKIKQCLTSFNIQFKSDEIAK